MSIDLITTLIRAEGAVDTARSCQHRPASARETCYSGPVAEPENPAAHGNITVRETCRCGAVRAVNINQHHEERGAWSLAPLYDARDDAQRALTTAEAAEQAAAAAQAAEQAAARRDWYAMAAQGLQIGDYLVRASYDWAAGAVNGVVFSANGHDVLVPLTDVRRAERDWADLPDSPQAHLYGRVARAISNQ